MRLEYQRHKGWIEIIAGSMFSGKSEELIRRIKRTIIANQKTITFKHKIDDRYKKDKVTSHNKSEIEAYPVKNVKEIREILMKYNQIDVVGIDEVQFFEEEIIDLAEELAGRGIRVILAGLDQDFRGESFKQIAELMVKAEYVDKLNAICTSCGDIASRTQRLVNGNPANYDDPIIMVGASEKYEARCRKCHEVLKNKKESNKLYFIVGTDTEIGKTFVTLSLLKEDINNNIKVTAIKPVETGLEIFKNYIGSDTYAYSELLNKKVEDINVYFFNKAVSPHAASKIENKLIDVMKIKEKIENELLENEIVYVEGAGGLLVPYNSNFTYLDLIKDFGKKAEVIIVSKNSLGTINHTLLTIDALKSNGIKIKGIVFNNKDNIKDEEFLNDNINIIEDLSGVKVIKSIDFKKK